MESFPSKNVLQESTNTHNVTAIMLPRCTATMTPSCFPSTTPSSSSLSSPRFQSTASCYSSSIFPVAVATPVSTTTTPAAPTLQPPLHQAHHPNQQTTPYQQPWQAQMQHQGSQQVVAQYGGCGSSTSSITYATTTSSSSHATVAMLRSLEARVEALERSFRESEEKRLQMETTVAVLRSDLIDEVKLRRELDKKYKNDLANSALSQAQQPTLIAGGGGGSGGVGGLPLAFPSQAVGLSLYKEKRQSIGPSGLSMATVMVIPGLSPSSKTFVHNNYNYYNSNNNNNTPTSRSADSRNEMNLNYLFQWLESKNLGELKPLWEVFLPNSINNINNSNTNSNNGCELSKKEVDNNVEQNGGGGGEQKNETTTLADMFSLASANPTSREIVLEKSSKKQLIDILFLQEDAPIRELWNAHQFVQEYVLTYQSFTSTKRLFKLLAAKCSQGSANILHAKDFIVKFTEYKRLDLQADSQLPREIEKFAKKIMEVNKDVAIEIQIGLNSALKPKTIGTPLESIVKGLPQFLKTLDILELYDSPVEIARQMTLLEQKYFHEVDSKEFLNKGWTSEKVEITQLDRYIEYTNHVSNLVTTEILSQHTPKLQAKVISLWLTVAYRCCRLHNFSSLGQILGCLHSSSISKLKQAWGLLPKKEKDELDRLTKQLSLKNHFEAYHLALQNLDPETTCVIPLVAATMHTLMYIEELQETFLEKPKDWVNWRKMRNVAEAIWEIRKFHLRYNFYPIPDVQEYFTDKAQVWDNADILYEIAKLRNENAELEFETLPPRPQTSNSGPEADFFKKNVLSDVELELLLVGTQPLQVPQGKVVVSREEPIHHLFYVKSGEFAVETFNSVGKKVLVGTLGPKKIFGTEALLRDTSPKFWKSNVWITAKSVSVLHKIDLENVYSVCSAEKMIFSKLNYILVGYLSTLNRSQIQTDLTETLSISTPKTRGGPLTPSKIHSKKKRIVGSLFKKRAPDFEEAFGLQDEVPIKQFSGILKMKGLDPMGVLFVSPNYVCFANYTAKGFVPVRHRVIIRIETIIAIGNTPKGIQITRMKDDEKEDFLFFGFDSTKEVCEFLISFCVRKQGRHEIVASKDPNTDLSNLNGVLFLPSSCSSSPAASQCSNWTLEASDWKKINAGSRELAFDEDEEIISEGETPYRGVFQIIEGNCYITKKERIVCKLGVGDIFDETSLILNTSEAETAVIAATDTKIRLIEGYYLDILFLYKPVICARFYHFMACMVAKKLHGREIYIDLTNTKQQQQQQQQPPQQLQMNRKSSF